LTLLALGIIDLIEAAHQVGTVFNKRKTRDPRKQATTNNIRHVIIYSRSAQYILGTDATKYNQEEQAKLNNAYATVSRCYV